MSRIDWTSASRGATVFPVLLVRGLPAIFCPEGATSLVTSFSLSSPDAAWWPTWSDWQAYALDVLRLDGDGLRITASARPTQAQLLDVSEITLRLSDVDGVVTTLVESSGLASATHTTAEISASATTLPVVNTAAFASSGVVYLDREAIGYSGKTATSFTGCTRGLYGSVPSRHLYNPARGAGMGNPQVTDRPVDLVGRVAMLWLVEVTAAGVLVRVQLEHIGMIGAGAGLAGGGESLDDGWSLSVDHAVKKLGVKFQPTSVAVGGYAHPGNASARTTLRGRSDGDTSPFWLRMGPTLGAVDAQVLLTGDDAPPDSGGWHESREAFVFGLSSVSPSVGSWRARLLDTGHLRIEFTSDPTAARYYEAWAPCTEAGYVSNVSATAATSFIADFGPMTEAWVPITGGSPVYVSADDYARVPAAPSVSGVSYLLVFGDDQDRTSRRAARITGQGVTMSGAYYLRCSPLTTSRDEVSGSTSTSGTAPPSPPGFLAWSGGFVVTAPTSARLAIYVESPSWVSALQNIVSALDVEYAELADAIDFNDMARIAAAFPSTLPARRAYVYDLDTSVLSLLQNEAQLNGFTLTLRNGRITIARVAEFATTEDTGGRQITTADLCASAPSPAFEYASDGIANTFRVSAPDAGVTVVYVDATSRARYGSQGEIAATVPRELLASTRDGARLYQQIAAQAIQTLGPHRYPYRLVRVQVPLHLYDLQIGDLVTATLWRVSDGQGGRGISEAIVQVMGRAVYLFGDGEDGRVEYTLRLNPLNLQGYAPSVLVAAGGISGAFVTADTTTLGPGGPARGTATDGGASTFVAGDYVRLVEIDSASPTPSTQHTVVSVSGSTIRLTPDPSPTFAALAASSLKVALVYDVWGSVQLTQKRFAFLGDSAEMLDGSTTGARIYAA